MKKLAVLTIFISLLLASCSTTYDASAPYDEVYAVPSDRVVSTRSVTTVTSQPVESTTAYEGDYYSPEYASKNVDTSQEFNPEGYYDYEYTSRIKRFHEPNPGFDYYNNYYVDQYYYTGVPSYYGSSIYSGWGCGGPSISIGLGFGWGWGSFGCGWGYPYYGWGYPYYGGYYPYGYFPSYWYYPPYMSYYPYWGWGYGSYWSGYWNGYYDGLYAGGGYYPTPYDYGNYYYGPRTSRGGASNGSNAAGDVTRATRNNALTTTGGEMSARATRYDANTSPAEGRATKTTEATPGLGENNTTRAVRSTEEGPTRTAGKEASVTGERPVRTENTARESNVTRTAAGAAAFEKPAGETQVQARETRTSESVPRYEKPTTASKESSARESASRSTGDTYMSPSRRVSSEAKYDKPKTYTSPTYRTTSSRQEYSSPSTRETGTVSRGTSTEPRRVYTQTPERRPAATYERSSSGSGSSFGWPSSRSNQNYTSPSRSTRNSYSAPSSPSRSTYSAPSRSYSAPSSSPARSSGSSGGATRSSSGGGGSSRGRR